MDRIRILYAANSLLAGGAESNLVDIVTHLDRSRYEPIILTLHNETVLPYHFGPVLHKANIPIYSLNLPYPPQQLRYYAKAIWRYRQIVTEIRPQIVQGGLFVINTITCIGRLLAPQHHLINVEQQGVYSGKRLRIISYTARFSDWVLPNSKQTYNLMHEKCSIPQSKLKLMLYGFPLDQFADNPNPQLRQELFPRDDFIAVVVARIHENKDHITLLKAIHKLKQEDRLHGKKIKVVFIGDSSSPHTQQEVDKFIEEHGLASIIEQLPATDQIVSYYHMADIKILPSIYESFGRVTIEAMATGTPVIISEAANVTGIVKHGLNGWQFPERHVDALASCLEEALQAPPEVMKKLGEHAREATKAFSIDTMMQRYIDLYDSLMCTSK